METKNFLLEEKTEFENEEDVTKNTVGLLKNDVRKTTTNKYYTYLLTNSIDNQVFYVGKGCGNRMYKHEKDVRLGKIPNKTNYDLFNKIKNIISLGGYIIYEKVKENMEEIESLALESSFIEFFGLNNLCNYTIGWSGNSIKSEKTKQRQSDALKGSKSYMFGKRKTEEQKLKNRLAHLGENNSRYDKTIYKFVNHELNLSKECTQYELRTRYNLDSAGLYYVLKGKRNSIKGWSLGISKQEIEFKRREKIKNKLKNRPKSDEHKKNLWKNRKSYRSVETEVGDFSLTNY